jgi:KDO2-lipid IV(A) lauroyltransferase
MRSLSALACALPRQLSLGLGEAFAGFVWALYRFSGVRNFVPGNIATAFPDWGERDVLALGRQSLGMLTRSIVDVMRFPRWHAEAAALVDLKGREHLDKVLAEGKGAIIATAHYGNWEVLGAGLSRDFAPLSVLVQTPSKDAFARLFEAYRRMVGVATYSNTGPQALRPVLRALRRGEIVGLLCDQHGEAREGQATFFGHRVWVPLGPFTLARRTGAAIVPARAMREGDRHVLEFFEPVPLSDSPDENAQALMSRYEAWIRERPDHWLWPHNRFEKAETPSGGLAAWPRHRAAAAKALLAAALLLIGCLAQPAVATAFKPVILTMPDKLIVLDTAHPDTHGAIPLKGRAEAALFLPSRQVLVVHMPAQSALALVDLQPFSPHQYQVFKTFKAPELGAYDLGIEEVAGKVLLGFGRTPIAELEIATWKLEVGFDRPDSIPFPFSTTRLFYLPSGIFTLKDGEVLFESIARNSHWRAATPLSIRFRYRPTAMVPGPVGRHLYVAQAGEAGKGALADVETETRLIKREMQSSGPLTSVVWIDDRHLAVLSGHHLGVVDVARWKMNQWFKIEAPGGKPLQLLPSHVVRTAAPRI